MINLYYINTNPSQLRFVFSIFRHGSRAPGNLDKSTGKDLFGNQWNLESELTPIGIRQQYLNGIKNRILYYDKLNITKQDFVKISYQYFQQENKELLCQLILKCLVFCLQELVKF
jgi:hypothetical protein